MHLYSVVLGGLIFTNSSADNKSDPSIAGSERDSDLKRAGQFSRSGTGQIKRLSLHSAVIDTFSHGMVLVTGEQLSNLEKSKSFHDGDEVCYEAALNTLSSHYKASPKTRPIMSENFDIFI